MFAVWVAPVAAGCGVVGALLAGLLLWVLLLREDNSLRHIASDIVYRETADAASALAAARKNENSTLDLTANGGEYRDVDERVVQLLIPPPDTATAEGQVPSIWRHGSIIAITPTCATVLLASPEAQVSAGARPLAALRQAAAAAGSLGGKVRRIRHAVTSVVSAAQERDNPVAVCAKVYLTTSQSAAEAMCRRSVAIRKAVPPSPYVARLHGAAIDAEGAVVVREWASRGTLLDAMAARLRGAAPCFTESEIAALARAIFAGLAALHDSGVTHGNVKAANCLLGNAASALVTLADPLLAPRPSPGPDAPPPSGKSPSAAYDAAGEGDATPAAARAADVLAAAVVLVEAATLRPAFFDTPDLGAAALADAAAPFPPPALPPEYSDAARAYLSACFARPPEARPEAGQLALAAWALGGDESAARASLASTKPASSAAKPKPARPPPTPTPETVAAPPPAPTPAPAAAPAPPPAPPPPPPTSPVSQKPQEGGGGTRSRSGSVPPPMVAAAPLAEPPAASDDV